ncbi:FAD dependent oxidoreductase [Fomitiporia mediterranea MF3/22]|uniref:FAD dependent oxidoreductase n=1 Tax=Fomitiporia mediterranea (strain MF3/22) TaxID=694068 RepID=UPI000440775E|nr:FAD dependent oxidoreductase [Fomitiporia mediterranea MF3/22]EJD08077.1 FAD dependent oxidoreductase [Fomitiporia mediterranea MF3/22]
MLARIKAFFTRTLRPTDLTPSTHSSASPPLVPSSKIVIVGSGCFGISTAIHLLQRGYTDVVVLDRASELPAADAASTDINKIVRSAYQDEFYTRLARDAIEAWKDLEVWGDNYHESGVVSCGSGESIHMDGSFRNDVKHGARVKQLATSVRSTNYKPIGKSESDTKHIESITLAEVFHSDIPLGSQITHTQSYFNTDGGWAYSKGAIERAMELVKKMGGKIIAGKEVITIIKDQSRTRGVKCRDGSEYAGDVVVLATGSWTASAFPELKLGKRAHATGQSIVTIQLTPEEGERYRNVPVVLDLKTSGFYCFPPTEDHLIKMGIHTGGSTNMIPPSDAPDVDAVNAYISTPRTELSHGEDGLKIPKSDAQAIRKCFRHIFPELAEKPFHSTRLCWYTDSPDSNWIIDVHPADPGLAFVTAGSGHGFKFLPVIGRLVADRLEGKMDDVTQRKFAVDREFDEHASYRQGAVISSLTDQELIGPGNDF